MLIKLANKIIKEVGVNPTAIIKLIDGGVGVAWHDSEYWHDVEIGENEILFTICKERMPLKLKFITTDHDCVDDGISILKESFVKYRYRRYKMKVAFLKGTGFVDKLIKFWTMSRYSHCELVFSDGTWFGNALDGEMKTGFKTRDANPAYWDFIELPTSEADEIKIKAFCEDEKNCKYDWTGIFLSQFIPLGIQSKTKWFCSEICTAALQEIGMLKGIKPYRVSPGKLNSLIKPKIN